VDWLCLRHRLRGVRSGQRGRQRSPTQQHPLVFRTPIPRAIHSPSIVQSETSTTNKPGSPGVMLSASEASFIVAPAKYTTDKSSIRRLRSMGRNPLCLGDDGSEISTTHNPPPGPARLRYAYEPSSTTSTMTSPTLVDDGSNWLTSTGSSGSNRFTMTI